MSIACYTVAAKSLLESGVDAIGVCASTFLLGSIVVLPFALGQGIGWARTGSGVLVALYLGLATMAVANILYARGLGKFIALIIGDSPERLTIATTFGLAARDALAEDLKLFRTMLRDLARRILGGDVGPA